LLQLDSFSSPWP